MVSAAAPDSAGLVIATPSKSIVNRQISPEALHRFLTLCTGCMLCRATGIYVYVGFQLRVGAPQLPFPWLQRHTQPSAAALSRVCPALMPPPAKPRCRR